MIDLATAVIAAQVFLIVGLAYLLARVIVANQDIRFQMAIGDRDRQLVDLRIERDNYRRMALQATIILENRVNKERTEKGEEPFPVVPAVVPEHNSPTTLEQREDAVFATLRARVAAAARELDEVVPDVRFPQYAGEEE